MPHRALFGLIDRNVLRIGVHELEEGDVPVEVAIYPGEGHGVHDRNEHGDPGRGEDREGGGASFRVLFPDPTSRLPAS